MDDFSISPSPRLIGGTMTHTGNGKTYVILGYVWLGETDRWGYLHRAAGEMGPMIARPVAHLDGVRSDGTPRYSNRSWEPYTHGAAVSTSEVLKEAREFLVEAEGWNGPEYTDEVEIAVQRASSLITVLVERLDRHQGEL